MSMRYCLPLPSTLPSYPCILRIRKLELTRCHFNPKYSHHPAIFNPNSGAKPKKLISASRNPITLDSDEDEFFRKLGLKEKARRRVGKESEKSTQESRDSGKSDGSGAEFLRYEVENSGSKSVEDLIRVKGSESEGLDLDLELDAPTKRSSGGVVRSGSQVIRRSSIIAKQVISMQSALSLGFVSQLWVDTNSWVVLVVEVRPNLLSGDTERFLLEDVRQVGDVVLIQDESMMDNEFKMAGLHTLVGYNVITPGQRKFGKVRGYTFNVNSGSLESLKLDSFGMSIIPSSLVSTYSLFVEDVLEVVSDAVIVHETAASRIQKLTKGFWDPGNVGTNIDALDESSDMERHSRSDYGQTRRIRRGRFSSRKSWSRMRETTDELELPMDYL